MEDVLLFQNFFAESNPSNAARKRRMDIYCRDIRIFEAKWGKNRVLTELGVLKFCTYQYYKILTTWLREKVSKRIS